MDSAAKEVQSADPNEVMAEVDTNGTVIKKRRRARNASRRQMSKSEPAGHLEEALDGAQDSDFTTLSSGEGQPLLQGVSLSLSI